MRDENLGHECDDLPVRYDQRCNTGLHYCRTVASQVADPARGAGRGGVIIEGLIVVLRQHAGLMATLGWELHGEGSGQRTATGQGQPQQHKQRNQSECGFRHSAQCG